MIQTQSSLQISDEAVEMLMDDRWTSLSEHRASECHNTPGNRGVMQRCTGYSTQYRHDRIVITVAIKIFDCIMHSRGKCQMIKNCRLLDEPMCFTAKCNAAVVSENIRCLTAESDTFRTYNMSVQRIEWIYARLFAPQTRHGVKGALVTPSLDISLTINSINLSIILC